MTEERFECWAILELMGHRRVAGQVREAEIGGGSLIRIDIPDGEGWKTQIYAPAAIYCITPVSEEIAREIAKASASKPLFIWELQDARRQLSPARADDEGSGELPF